MKADPIRAALIGDDACTTLGIVRQAVRTASPMRETEAAVYASEKYSLGS